jgi:uncharacterized membrane protein
LKLLRGQGVVKCWFLFILAVLLTACSQGIKPQNSWSQAINTQHSGQSNTVAVDPVAREHSINNVWHKARLRGVAFRAIGQEPAWLLEITEGSEITVMTDYGQTKTTYNYVKPKVNQAARITYYMLDELTVQIEGKPCIDIMSGEQFDTAVELQFSDQTLKGCGRALY